MLVVQNEEVDPHASCEVTGHGLQDHAGQHTLRQNRWLRLLGKTC